MSAMECSIAPATPSWMVKATWFQSVFSGSGAGCREAATASRMSRPMGSNASRMEEDTLSRMASFMSSGVGSAAVSARRASAMVLSSPAREAMAVFSVSESVSCITFAMSPGPGSAASRVCWASASARSSPAREESDPDMTWETPSCTARAISRGSVAGAAAESPGCAGAAESRAARGDTASRTASARVERRLSARPVKSGAEVVAPCAPPGVSRRADISARSSSAKPRNSPDMAVMLPLNACSRRAANASRASALTPCAAVPDSGPCPFAASTEPSSAILSRIPSRITTASVSASSVAGRTVYSCVDWPGAGGGSFSDSFTASPPDLGLNGESMLKSLYRSASSRSFLPAPKHRSTMF